MQPTLFILIKIQNSYEIYWKDHMVSNHMQLKSDYQMKYPNISFEVIGGGTLLMKLDKKQMIFYGNSPEFGHFNIEIVYNIGQSKYKGWEVIPHTWSENPKQAIKSWTDCNFKYQLFRNIISNVIYSAILKTGQELPSLMPTGGRFIILKTKCNKYPKGTFINSNEIYEIKRISHSPKGNF